MRKEEQNQIKRYISKGRTVSRSKDHEDLWIVDCTDGKTFFTITASTDLILQLNPPDEPKTQNLDQHLAFKRARL